MTTAYVARLCDQFWRAAGPGEPFPRDLTTPIAWALPLSVCTLSRLSIDALRDWLRQHGLAAETGPRRRLHACLVAYGGRGFVLLDGRDGAAQRRFSLAHEAGHFLAEYQEPRRQALHALGAGIRPVLDGERPANGAERAMAVLAGRPMQLHLHLMERDAAGYHCGPGFGAECLADDLALELLAPEAVVLDALPSIAPDQPYAERERAAEHLLETHFGLPSLIAGRYARRLLRRQTGGPSTREWLGIAGSG